MTITVKIKTDTPTGKRLENELRQYPEAVEFVHTTVVSNNTPEEYNETISAAESAKLTFQKLGEKYNCTFENKYTRFQ